MISRAPDGDGTTQRTGARALALLADPLSGLILGALATGPKRPRELRHEIASSSAGALRCCLKALERFGTIAKCRRTVLLGSREYELMRPGEELRFVGSALERWLGAAPDEPHALGSPAGQAAVGTLVDAWSSTVLSKLAARPLSLAELDGLIGTLDRPSIERRLKAMRLTGMATEERGAGASAPFAMTRWMRHSIGPIVAASRWERRNIPEQSREIDRIDAQTAMMMAVPLLQLPMDVAGACRMIVEPDIGGPSAVAPVTVSAEAGRVVRWVPQDESADAWASGSPNAWFRAAIEADPEHLDMGGDRRLARCLADALFGALYGSGARRAT